MAQSRLPQLPSQAARVTETGRGQGRDTCDCCRPLWCSHRTQPEEAHLDCAASLQTSRLLEGTVLR